MQAIKKALRFAVGKLEDILIKLFAKKPLGQIKLAIACAGIVLCLASSGIN
jgi:hypothetical protein